MPTLDSAYNRMLMAARLRVNERLAATLQQMFSLYANMLVDIVAYGESLPPYSLSRQRASVMAKDLREILTTYGQGTLRVVADSARFAAEAGARGHALATETVSTMAGRVVQVSFAEIPAQAMQRMVLRRNLARSTGLTGFSGTFKTLIQNGLQEQAALFDNMLERAVGTGISQTQLTKQIAAALAQNDPDVARALRSLGPRGGRTRAAIAQGVSVEQLGRTNVARARALLRRSQLIAIHEINSAFDESEKMAAAKSPVVQAVKWQVSGRHAGLWSSPDICDLAAEADTYGLGPGVYPPEACPSLMHPRCGCSTVKVLRRPEEWGKPRPKYGKPKKQTKKSTNAAMSKAHVTAERPATQTERRLERTTAEYNARVRAAYDVAKRNA
jgi:hypothetical protein